jgi:hypothetical protein
MDVALICNGKENYLVKLDVLRAQRSPKHEELIPTLTIAISPKFTHTNATIYISNASRLVPYQLV